MTWRVVWTTRAFKDADRLDPKTRQRIAAALERYGATGEGDVVKLAGVNPPEHRLRVGEYRLRLRLGEGVVQVLRVLPRGRAYR